ncbi:MAG: hypothetical protein EI684_09235 [Candidatus Viridilinea halotolerans]|uniref:ATPase AAA-type core domain-containing protein n=1 Tax=Candidatus Viridilinea halotolerans TaxID=2491704 RepID=A0A426U1G7_9CHLR|nr:MAG: hypothetical protein EI684_09235 [Candidatus Viridilinea halotolerans]
MRLRYLYLPDLPPLSQIRIEFGRGAPLLIDRACAIRFVVGVNGTGKSRLMQALAEIMLTLEAPRLPGFNFVLAYDLGQGATARTIFIRHLDSSPAQALLIEFAGLAAEATNWLTLETLRWDDDRRAWNGPLPTIRFKREDTEPWAIRTPEEAVRARFRGDNLPSMRGGYLPTILLAYTSGDLRGWETLFRAAGRAESIEATPQRERPRGWTRADDLEDQRRVRTGEIIAALRRGETEVAQRLLRDETSQPELREEQTESRGILVTPQKLKLAVCAVALHQAVQDFRRMPDRASEETFIEQLDQAQEQAEETDELRRILNQVDWLWPITISLRIDMHSDRLTTPHKHFLWRLYQFSVNGPSDIKRKPENLRRLVTNVIRDPAGNEGRLLVYDLRKPLADYPSEDQTSANALLETIAAKTNATPFEIFRELNRLHDDGLLEDTFLTVRKRHTDDLLLYDWLSDGEQVFLGRMALFHLLQGMGDALVLLDEPETHFNDIWKREIVSLIDAAIGDEPSDVVISTHSSITLSDVANEEIELLYREDGHTVAGSIRSPTFGADPSEIMVHIFGADDSIGRRSLDRLDALLSREWTTDDIDWLERVIRQVGPGYHRSELRTILRKLRALQS